MQKKLITLNLYPISGPHKMQASGSFMSMDELLSNPTNFRAKLPNLSHECRENGERRPKPKTHKGYL